jgi:hypothetical protein
MDKKAQPLYQPWACTLRSFVLLMQLMSTLSRRMQPYLEMGSLQELVQDQDEIILELEDKCTGGRRGWGHGSSGKVCLLSKCEALSSNPSTAVG